MATENTALQELKTFLNKLFQFESQDLDFGIYKILHYKRNEIKQFIDEMLVNRVKEQLQTLSSQEAQKAETELQQLVEEKAIKNWLEAKAKNDTKRLEIYEEDYRKEIHKFNDVERIVRTARAAGNAENIIYNHLSLFFSRYYDKGDFISKRRFGKNEKYMVPYNGEETHFYWANHDQYYIKSAEHFQKYSFKAPYLNGTLVVNFKLAEAETEQGNVKADENRYFVLSEKEPELSGDELNIYFEYRALTEQEKKDAGNQNKQDKLDEKAAKVLEEKFKGNKITYQLWETKEDQSLLLQHLHRYTRKNKYDFFIHKNLKGFLQRELDYYIKSELVNVDDLYVLETDLHFDRIRHNFRTIKVFKNIADTIIEFLAQIEDFQKKLWEKKKFVLSTEWVITIDRLVEWLGEEGAKPFMLEALKNEKQCSEWEDLFGEKHVPPFKPVKANIEKLKHNLYSWKKLPIDTIHFSPEFKVNLVNALSENINLEEKLDGLVIHSDNFHGLSQLQEKFHSSIQAVYIDPPYNTDASQIIYKNGYKLSSWTTLINDRIIETKALLKSEGILCATIDDFQQRELYSLLIENFSKSAMLATVVIRNNPSGRPVPSGFGISHEYAFFVAKSPNVTIGKFERTDAQNKRYKEKDQDSTFMWELLRKRGSDSERKDSPKAFFPLYYKKDKLRVPQMDWNDAAKTWINIEKPSLDEIILWPVDENNTERRWRWGLDTIKSNLDQLKVEFDKNKIGTVYYKYRPPQHSIPLTNWIDSKYSATEHGTGILKNLFKQYNPFSYPKSLYAVADSLTISSGNLKEYFCLDYFGGSGTTFHATQYLNKSDEGKRKCILIEQGDYIYSIVIPRIKKIAYTFDWKNGHPINDNMNGLGIFFKYQRLEQYEEALENIAFSISTKTVQKALEFKDYIPKYFLEFETRDSQTLVNTEAMADPWDYQLKVWDGFTYDTQQAVDMVETFNYLIGLHMHKSIIKEIEGQRYQFVYGRNNSNKQILIIWRNVRDWDLAAFEADGKVLREELKKWTYDVLYINGQAHVEGYQPIEEVFKNKMNA